MSGLQAWLAVIGGVLGVLGVVVALTRYITNVQAHIEQAKLASENRALGERIASLETQRNLLMDQIAVGSRAGSAAMFLKAQIDDSLRALMQKIGATGGSIYVPVRSPRGGVQGLAFLSIEPFTVETQVLKTKVIPLKSLAGRCFTTEQPFLTTNTAVNPDHFKPAETIAAYKPSTMLNLPLKCGDETVGALQLLRREGEASFSEGDLGQVALLLGELPVQVSEIARTPEYLKVLGLGGEDEPELGTALVFDLSHSAWLFEELSAAFALRLLNEYFEKMCDIAFAAGATLENYMGDGALLGFNVPRRLPNHELVAVRAAMDMNRAFAELRDAWGAISPRLSGLHNRTAVATGPLHRATMGHPLAERLTLIGYPISVAAALCDLAAHDRDVLVIDSETQKAVSDRILAEPLAAPAGLGKAAPFTSAAFEVTGLR